MIGKLTPGIAVVKCDSESGEPIRNARGYCERVGPGETGLLLGIISRITGFDGYLDRKATQKKVMSNVFGRGDRYFDTGDLVKLHEERWVSFVDRVGDTVRHGRVRLVVCEVEGRGVKECVVEADRASSAD